MGILDLFKINEFKRTITYLRLDCDSYKKMIKELESNSTQQQNKISHLESELNKCNSFIKTLRPFYDLEKQKIPSSFESLQRIWSNWGFDIHSTESQLRRQERACSSILSPLKLDVENMYGCFRGTETNYTTTLLNCECMDFQRRSLPCKHMYRLAYEFDVFMLDDVEYNPNIKDVFSVHQFKDVYSHLTVAQQSAFSTIAINDGIVFDNESDIQKLIKIGFVECINNDEWLLYSYTKEDLFRLIPSDANIKIPKSTKKQALINLIINSYPSVVEELRKYKICVAPSFRVTPILSKIYKFLI